MQCLPSEQCRIGVGSSAPNYLELALRPWQKAWGQSVLWLLLFITGENAKWDERDVRRKEQGGN